MKKIGLLYILTWLFTVSLYAQRKEQAEVVWFDGRHPITYQLPTDVEPVVMTALEMWKNDMLLVTGMIPKVSGKATVEVVKTTNLPADGFRIYVKNKRIIIEGSNGRGMAYGLLELSRLADVSPWV